MKQGTAPQGAIPRRLRQEGGLSQAFHDPRHNAAQWLHFTKSRSGGQSRGFLPETGEGWSGFRPVPPSSFFLKIKNLGHVLAPQLKLTSSRKQVSITEFSHVAIRNFMALTLKRLARFCFAWGNRMAALAVKMEKNSE